jgi:hypothetical protein
MRHGLRERVAPILAFGGTAAALPALLLHYFGRKAGRSLDGDCVEALERVLSWEREPEPEPARRPTSVRRGRTRPATPAAETS